MAAVGDGVELDEKEGSCNLVEEPSILGASFHDFGAKNDVDDEGRRAFSEEGSAGDVQVAGDTVPMAKETAATKDAPLRGEAWRTQFIVFLVMFASTLVTALALVVRSLYLDARQYTIGIPAGDHTKVGMAAFGCALVLSICIFMCRTEKDKRTSAALVAYVNGTAFLTYVLLNLECTPVLVTHFGRALYPARFLQWMLTTPIMVYLTAVICGQSHRQIMWSICCDLFMLMMGLSGLLSSSHVMSGLFLSLAGFAFVTTLRNLYRMIGDAIQEARDLGCHWNFRFLQGFVLTTWTAFPCVAFLSETNLVSPMTEAYLFLVLELACKVVFSALLLEGSFLAIEENRRVADATRENTNKNSLIEQLRQAITEKNRFLASVSHELRTPLNGIIGLSETMLQGSLGEVNDDMKQSLETIKQSGGRLKNLVNDILDVESLRQQKLTLHYGVINLRQLVEHVMELTSPMVKWNVKLYNDVPEHIPELEGDQERLIQVLHNLIGNAAKFTDGGEIRVSARVRENDDGLEFMVVDVRDTGIGIPSHKLRSIFLAFEQVNETSTDQRGGTGLGLFLAESLVRAHSGTISVTSEVGQGSCFTFKLPLKQVDSSKMRSGTRSRLVSFALKIPLSDTPKARSPGGGSPKATSPKATSPKATSPKGTSPEATSPKGSSSEPASPKRAPSPEAASPGKTSPAPAAASRCRSFVSSNGRGRVTVTPKTAPAGSPEQAVASSPVKDRAAALNAGAPGASTPGTCAEKAAPPQDDATTPQRGIDGTVYVGDFRLSRRVRSAPVESASKPSANETRQVAAFSLPEMRQHKPPEVELSFKDTSAEHSSTAVHYPTKLRSYYEVHGQYEILSVDDDRVNQMVVDGLLRPAGYKITKKMDGMEALAYLKGSDVIPDLILLDVMMPGLDGYEVCKRVRQMFPASALPVIMVSAKSQEGDIVKGLRAGSNDYLTKPFKRLEILARIETQLKIKKLWRVEMEARKTYKLLKMIMPESIIERLSAGQTLIADSHKEVTILFSDIVGFTEISGSSPTEDLILMLNEMFTSFDALVDKHGVYKVETIGDAYMVVAGHDGSPDHASRIVRMAMDMLAVVRDVKQPNHVDPVRIRVGIHTGPAYAGVIGTKCPRYCFFGDTVNTASRMESNGFPMSIHTSMTTYERCRDSFEFGPVGRRIIKGKGPMETFLLKYGEYEAALQALRADNLPPLARSDSSPDLLKRHVASDHPVSPLLRQSLEAPGRALSRFKSRALEEGTGETGADARSGYDSDDVSSAVRPSSAPGRVRKLERTRTVVKRALGSALPGVEVTPETAGSFSGMTAGEEESARLVSADPVRTLLVDESTVKRVPVAAARAMAESARAERDLGDVAVSGPEDLELEPAQQKASGQSKPEEEDGTKRRTGLEVTKGSDDQSRLFDILNGLGLGRYASALEEAEVTVDILPTMTPEQLKEAGVQAIGARLRILEAFKASKAVGSA